MPQALLAAPIVLAVVLGAGGVLKMHDDDAATALEWDAMGLPAALNKRWARRAHPWVELLLAFGLVLLAGPLAMVWALAALVLTATYLVLVARAVAGGGVSCNCFGADHAAPLTGWTVARNAVLVVLAALSAWRLVAGASPLDVFREEPSTTGWALAVVVAMATTVLVAAPPSAARDRVTESGTTAAPEPVPEVGAGEGEGAPVEVTDPAVGEVDEEEYLRTLTPAATLRDADGTVIDLLAATRRQAHLLVFLSPGCGPCSQVAPHVPEWVETMPQIAVRTVVTMGPEQLADRAPDWKDWTLYDQDGTAGRMLRCLGTPSAVLLGTDGMLAGGPVAGAGSIMEFVEDIKAQLSAS